jgi:molecular chaperone DnaK
MYKANASAGAPTDGATAASGTTEEAKKDEGVIDAEYVDVDDKK